MDLLVNNARKLENLKLFFVIDVEKHNERKAKKCLLCIAALLLYVRRLIVLKELILVVMTL